MTAGNPKLRALIRLDNDEPSAISDLLRVWKRSPESLLSPWSATDFESVMPRLSASDQAGMNRKIDSWIGTTPLHQAAGSAGHCARTLSEALRALKTIDPVMRPSVDVRDLNGLTPLSRAVRSDCASRIHALVQEGANPREVYRKPDPNDPAHKFFRHHWSYVRFASATGRVSALAALLSQGADYIKTGRDGKRPLHLAIERGHLGCVQNLLNADLENIDNLVDEKRRTAIAIDKFLVKSAAADFLKVEDKGHSSDTMIDDPGIQTADSSSSEEEDWDTRREVDDNEVSEEQTLPNAFHMLGYPRMQDRRIINPFATSQTDANNSIDGAAGLARIITQALGQSVGESHDETAGTLTVPLGINRDRGSSLYHLASSYGKPSVLAYLLGHSTLKKYHPHDVRNEQGKVPIFMAARSGNIPCLSIFVDYGVSLNSVDLENWTILNEAVKYNRIEAIQYIITNGGNVTLADDDGWTPLHVAGRFGIVDAIPILCAHGGDINLHTEERESPLLLATSQPGHENVVRSLLIHGAAVNTKGETMTPLKIILDRRDYSMLNVILAYFIEAKKSQGRNPLDISHLETTDVNLMFLCVAESKPDTIRYLLELGMKCDFRNSSGDSPLCAAVRVGKTEVAKALLECGANPEYTDQNGSRPIHIASDEGFTECVSLLVQHGANVNAQVPSPATHVGFTPLMLSSRRGHTKTVKELALNLGANLNMAKSDGYTAVHLAALNGQVEALQILLDAGADHSKREENSFAPLHVAVRNNQLEIVRTLLTAGVDPDQTGPSMLTALHFASYMANARMIWLLISVNADVSAKDTDDSQPLHVAAGREKGRVAVQMLLTQGADLVARDSQGYTPLHSAAYRGLYSIVRVLLRRGSAVDVKDNIGLTPLHLATENGSEATVSSLIRAGADVSIRSNAGETAYNLAVRKDNTKLRVIIWRASGQTLEDLAPVTQYAVKSPEATPEGSMEIEVEYDQGRTICVVCQSALRYLENVRELACGHVYHQECIDQWFGGNLLEEHNNCVLCQTTVLPGDIR